MKKSCKNCKYLKSFEIISKNGRITVHTNVYGCEAKYMLNSNMNKKFPFNSTSCKSYEVQI